MKENQDDLIEEARQAGQSYIDSFKGDWQVMLDDLRRRSEADGRKPVSLPSKPPRLRVMPRPVTAVPTPVGDDASARP